MDGRTGSGEDGTSGHAQGEASHDVGAAGGAGSDVAFAAEFGGAFCHRGEPDAWLSLRGDADAIVGYPQQLQVAADPAAFLLPGEMRIQSRHSVRTVRTQRSA